MQSYLDPGEVLPPVWQGLSSPVISLDDISKRRYSLIDHYREDPMEGIHIEHMFGQLKFTKLGSEIKAKAEAKAVQVSAKIKERQVRISTVCEKYNITPADLFALAQMYAGNRGRIEYKSTVLSDGSEDEGPKFRADIPAGKIAEIGQESSLIESEKNQLEKLNLIARNIDPGVQHQLSYDELKYLGF